VRFLYINLLISLFYNRYLTDYFELFDHKIDKLLIKRVTNAEKKHLENVGLTRFEIINAAVWNAEYFRTLA